MLDVAVVADVDELELVLLGGEASDEDRLSREPGGAEHPRRVLKAGANGRDDAVRGPHLGLTEEDRRGRRALFLHVEDETAFLSTFAADEDRDAQPPEAARAGDPKRRVDDLDGLAAGLLRLGERT